MCGGGCGHIIKCFREKAAQDTGWRGPGLGQGPSLGCAGAGGAEATGSACCPGIVWGMLFLTYFISCFNTCEYPEILLTLTLLTPHENEQVCWDRNATPPACLGDVGASLALGPRPSPAAPAQGCICRPRTGTPAHVSPALWGRAPDEGGLSCDMFRSPGSPGLDKLLQHGYLPPETESWGRGRDSSCFGCSWNVCVFFDGIQDHGPVKATPWPGRAGLSWAWPGGRCGPLQGRAGQGRAGPAGAWPWTWSPEEGR